jgi:hypothetical protein
VRTTALELRFYWFHSRFDVCIIFKIFGFDGSDKKVGDESNRKTACHCVHCAVVQRDTRIKRSNRHKLHQARNSDDLAVDQLRQLLQGSTESLLQKQFFFFLKKENKSKNAYVKLARGNFGGEIVHCSLAGACSQMSHERRSDERTDGEGGKNSSENSSDVLLTKGVGNVGRQHGKDGSVKRHDDGGDADEGDERSSGGGIDHSGDGGNCGAQRDGESEDGVGELAAKLVREGTPRKTSHHVGTGETHDKRGSERAGHEMRISAAKDVGHHCFGRADESDARNCVAKQSEPQ